MITKITKAVTALEVTEKINLLADGINSAANNNFTNISANAQEVIKSLARSPEAASIYEGSQGLSANTSNILLQDNVNNYDMQVTTNLTINFDVSQLSRGNTAKRTFSLLVMMPNPVSVIFNNVQWLDNEAPDISTAGVYLFAFTAYPNWTNKWIGNLQGKA